MNFFWSKTFERKCPDGTTRIIHKNIDSAFPLHIQSAHSKTNVEIQGLKKIKGKLSTEYQSKIDGMLYELDEMNSTLMMKFRSAYVLFQANPCNGYNTFSQEILKINNEHHRMSLLKAKMKLLIDLALSNTSESLSKQVKLLLDDFKVVQTATIEIDENRDLMKQLKEKKDGI